MRFAVAALLLFLSLSPSLHVSAASTGDWQVGVKSADGPLSPYWVTLANGQVLGKTAGVPAAITPLVSGDLTPYLLSATAATTYEPIIGTGTLALSKLATDPLARANHTGTQLLSTISDAGSLAALSTITTSQITDGTIVNADISASAAIAVSKISGLGSAALLTAAAGGSGASDENKVPYFNSLGYLMAKGFAVPGVYGSSPNVDVLPGEIRFTEIISSRSHSIMPSALSVGSVSHVLPDRSGTFLHADGNGSALTGLSPYQLAQVSATDGQVLTWSASNSRWQPGAGGSGVTSITGTANEITVTGTTTPTLSLPSALTFSGKTITGGTYASPSFSGAVSSSATHTFSASGAASSSAITISGVPFGGTAATSFPLVYLNETGATSSSTLNTGGTVIGINANTTSGNFVDFMQDGTSKFSVNKFGAVVIGSSLSVFSTLQAGMFIANGCYLSGGGAWPSTWLVYGTGDSSKGGTFAFPPRTPAQLTSNQNNYNPLAGASETSPKYIRLSTDASRDVTGLVFTVATQSGQEHVIINVGSFDLVLKHESASSTAANRFTCSTGADITLTAGQSADFWYDSTTSRWRVTKRN